MGSTHRHKVMNKYRDDMDMIFGDDLDSASKGMEYASTGVSAISEIIRKQAEAKKAEKEAAARKKMQDEATDARQKAEHARIDAMSEADQSGPKHILAAQLDAQARLLEQKAMGMPIMPGGAIVPSKPSAQRPWYFYAGIIGGSVVGVTLLGAVMYKLAGGGHHGSRR